MNLYKTLQNVLQEQPAFVDEDGKLKKQIIIEQAHHFNATLIETLLSDEDLKREFFKQIDDDLFFYKDKFVQFLEYKNYLPDSYTKHDNKIGLALGGGARCLTQSSDIVLNFPYKDCILEGGASKTESARKEIFFNEILARDEITQLTQPKVLTNGVSHYANQQQPFQSFSRRADGNISDHLVIEGNNLLALHCLKKQFAQKVKLIYIDPPYNTGNDDFKYNNHFNHSTWLTFMKNRLEVAKSLLKDDGIIVISIDDRESAYLKVLCDEIFERENFIATIPRKTRSSKSDVPYGLSQNFDWLLIYTKNADTNQKLFKKQSNRPYYKSNDFEDEWRISPLTSHRTIEERPNSNFTIINPKNGQEFPVNPKRAWSVTKDTFPKYLKAGKIVFPGDYPKLFPKITEPKFRIFKCEDIRKKGADFDKATVNNNDFFMEFVKDKYLNDKGGKDMLQHFDGKVFAFPKPVALIKKIVEYATSEGDIILDFFAGSGTTGEAVLILNAENSNQRQFILIEQLSEHINICRQRLTKVIAKGGG